MKLDSPEFERIPVYSPEETSNERFSRFMIDWGNTSFRRSRLTIVSLILLLVLYPGMSVVFAEDPAVYADKMNEGVLLAGLIATIFLQWSVFLPVSYTHLRAHET